ncbi:NAD-dependent epimerase/dehydratase family protein [Pontibacillus marinus]|uniref:NAD-dependent epimerase/dehydratase domain-containing protein n=1 Tax=Pontibacillus marinus BH030004 = DSM 16465 TaxID=1385511 RepID=A0A0A5G4R2_9BACI|nr:NAD(P)-dependent oxidoreductase [Pontibacillus marinus]KGX86065.1 hypothetical protein N783_12815 [Pontibacillus marinus BH030004 = DSM 16465]
MTKLVWGCFQWVGFHLIREWLDDGETVIGIDIANTEQKETLEMFVGRNTNFSRVESVEEALNVDAGECIDALIALDDQQHNPPFEKLREISASHYFRVNVDGASRSTQSWTTIELPHVYGPWMTSESTSITEKSVYVSDITPVIKSIVTQPWDTDLIKVGMESNEERNDKCIAPTISLEKGMKMLKDHQKRFPSYYY